ncbi:unnamed protein product [Vitrella brassicaformis CCMP3155]|uniref:Uncharacterized protein n=1 Tax=Vitrella brassicaformis (strain CCMP3155) TaxID=1169540 RepID=A0A0G4GXT1_VITBC|nr:unnamed protein product [Vitrella brassicaformis CCMP3155]|eukprot:CEM35912.1 unnamed protein product [Vitrella brassicaformis CCMP3155]
MLPLVVPFILACLSHTDAFTWRSPVSWHHDARRSAARPLQASLRGLQQIDATLRLKEGVQEVLTDLLSQEKMTSEVCQVTTAESAEFTGLLFEPQPYSISTRHGMPQEMEHYHFDPSYAIVTVPATIMFKAKCLSPSRLCAVFKVSGVKDLSKVTPKTSSLSSLEQPPATAGQDRKVVDVDESDSGGLPWASDEGDEALLDDLTVPYTVK